jgi:ribosomal RNA-processing protein 12
VESNKERVSLTDDDDTSYELLRVSKPEAEANLQHLRGFASNILAVLFNVYTTTLPQYRAPALQCINSYLSITDEKEVVETFERVIKMLEDSLAETNGQSKTRANGKSKDLLPPISHTLMDLVITIALYLPRQSYAKLFGVATVLLQKTDPNLQKKAYKIVPRMAESELGRQALQERSEELQTLMLGCSENVLPAARRDRLASISQLIENLPSTGLHFIPSILPEVVLATKETNEKARKVAFELLIAMGEKMKDGGTIVQSKVPHMPNDAAPVAASLDEFFTMVSAGLAGSAAHTVSATITAMTRILYHFRESLTENTIAELVETMDIFLKSQNREIVRSVLGFVKVCVISLPTKLVQPRLATLIPNLLSWSHEHKAHLQAKVKHIFERMIRRFGAELIEKLTPEKDRKLVTNIRKTRERRKKKKLAGDEEEDDEEAGGNKPRRKFESGLDEAIYGESDTDSGSDMSDDEVLGRERKRRGPSGETYIVEDEDEPLDLLDKRALGHISSTRPLKKALGKPKARNAKVNLDGKLVFGGEDTSMQDVEATSGAAAGSEGGVNAYVQALKGGNAARKGQRGKIKFSNKPNRENDDDEEEMEVDGQDLVQQLKKARPQKKGAPGSPGNRPPMRGGMKAAKAQRRGLGVEKTRGGRVTKGSTAKVGRY